MASAAPLPIKTSKAQRLANVAKRASSAELRQNPMGSESASSSQFQEGKQYSQSTAGNSTGDFVEEQWGQPLPFPPNSITEAGKALLDDARKAKAKAEKAALSLQQPRGLDPLVKARMIELFALFQGVSQVELAIKREFGLSLDRRTIEGFNPDSVRSRVGKRLRRMFDQHRAAYVEAVAKQGVAHQAHRLKLIGDLVEKASNSKDFNAALRGLELAAKEVGGLASVQTVRHEGTVGHAHVHASIDDAKAELAMRLSSFVDAMPALSLPSPATVDTVPSPTEGDAGG